jgi:hypothetical protein
LAARREKYKETSGEEEDSEEYEQEKEGDKSEDAELSSEDSSTEDEMLYPSAEIGDNGDVIKYSRAPLASSSDDAEDEIVEVEKHGDEWDAELGMTKSELHALQFGTRTRSKRAK